MALIGYARTSTQDQNLDAQLDALTAAGCERVFTDQISGKLAHRPQLDAALDYLRPGDMLVCTKLDRLGRSVRNLITLTATLAERGIDLRVLHQGIDTSTPAGKLTFHVLAAIAEFERDLISERTRDGLAAARARGRKGGRPSKLTPAKLATARQLYDAKERTVADIADIVGVGRSTLYRALGARVDEASR
ncbi:DNA invertase [Pseudonocardia sp. CNS-139]|nr:DNA invertase [Pseudonocardia sp. CNS-139]